MLSPLWRPLSTSSIAKRPALDDTAVMTPLRSYRRVAETSFYRESSNSMLRIKHDADKDAPSPGDEWVLFCTTYITDFDKDSI